MSGRAQACPAQIARPFHLSRCLDGAVVRRSWPLRRFAGALPVRTPPVASAQSLDLNLIGQLRVAGARYGGRWTARKSRLLDRCAARALDHPRCLVEYHDCLLFLLAYPEHARLLSAAERELARVALAARTIAERGSARERRRLCGTGIAWSEVSFGFSFEIARWLAQRYPDHADIQCFGEGGELPQNVLRLGVPGMEFELLAPERLAPEEFLMRARGPRGGSALGWLVAQMQQLPCSEAIRDQLFETLHAFIRVEPRDTPLSRTFARGPLADTHFHGDGLLRDVDPPALIAEPLPPPRRLSVPQRSGLLACARAMLIMLGRETEPLTYGSPSCVEYFQLGRGLGIALYYMRPERRFAIDSHVGFMLFKNTIPVGYGGGWPFLDTCKIGVNMFAPFRGGESAFCFCQVLRAYRQRFEPVRFVVEPYQFGAGNREGLTSGAFWFYYRLGFRPIEPTQAQLAEAEFVRISAERFYRSPLSVMRRLTRSNIELRLAAAGDAEIADCDPADLSLAVSRRIAHEHGGDRAAAGEVALRYVTSSLGVRDMSGWSGGERQAFGSLSLLLALVPRLSEWSVRERRACVALMRAKGGDEARYFVLARRHRRFREAMIAIAAAEASCAQ